MFFRFLILFRNPLLVKTHSKGGVIYSLAYQQEQENPLLVKTHDKGSLIFSLAYQQVQVVVFTRSCWKFSTGL